jgi:hypothetical protein
MGSNTGWFNNAFGYLQIAVSTLYDDSKQESALASVQPILDINKTMDYLGNQDLDNMVVTTGIFTEDTNEFGKTYPRVSGFKVYIRHSTSTGGQGPWYLLQEIDIEKGGRLASETNGEYVMWRSNFYYSGHAGDCASTENGPSNYAFNPFPSFRTYESETGSSSDETVIVDAYKTAVVANRMAYIGNIKQNGVVYGDRVLKSNVNKFDRFPESRVIEASVNDGDNIVKLESYADRLLIFKKNKLELLNISQEIEFLEDTFIHKGVSHPAATCKTDFGIAWVNKQGVYLYDGQKVNNLFEKQGRQIIKESNWSDWFVGTDTPMIGYISKKRQLVIRQDIAGQYASDSDVYLYDMVTGSWVTGDHKIPPIGDLSVTNFTTDWNNDLIIAHATGTIVKWDDSAVNINIYSSAIDIRTKDIDFGQPGQKKNVYKVYVTYTGGTSGPQPEKTKVVCNADSDSLAGTYFIIYGTTGKTLVWLDVDNDNSPSIPLGLSEDLVLEVQGIVTNDPAEKVAIEIANTVGDHADFLTEVQGTTVIITDVANATRTNAFDGASLKATGFDVTTIQEGTGSTVAQNIDVKYSVNGASSTSQFDANLTDSTGNQVEAELTPSASISNIKSIKLRFDGTAASTFEINDITIVYRLKGQR